MEEQVEEKKKKKLKSLKKVTDIDSSFDVFEDRLNYLLKRLQLKAVDEALYQKNAQSKLGTRVFKSAEEKKFWHLLQINFFRGKAVRAALNSLQDEFKNRGEKTKKIIETIPLTESIQNALKIVQKNSKNAFSFKAQEFNDTQDILDEKARLLEAQLAIDIKGGLKDDKTAIKMKGIASLRAETTQSNIVAIEAIEEILEILEELEGAAGLMALAASYYKRHSKSILTVGILLVGITLIIFAALIYKKLYPLFSKSITHVTQSKKGSGTLQKAEEEVEDKITERRELTPDELFKASLLKKERFIPNCNNSYVVSVGDNLADTISVKEAKIFLLSRKIPVEGKNSVQIIKVKNESELEIAIKNGALNSPYCVRGKLFLTGTLGYDLGRFPVYLPHGFDPSTQNAQIMIKEQLDFTKRKMRRSMIFLMPKLFFGEEENETIKSEEYRKAVKEYLKNYRQAMMEAEGKKKGS